MMHDYWYINVDFSFSTFVLLWQSYGLRGCFTGTCRWGEFGEGGLLWGECVSRHFEWFEGNPVTELLSKVHISYEFVFLENLEGQKIKK